MKIVPVGLGLALVVAVGVAIHFRREVQAGRQQIAELQARLQERETQPVAVPVMQATSAVAVSPLSAEAAHTSAMESAAAADRRLSAMREQQSSPEERAHFLRSSRESMEAINPDIAEALGLSPGEADNLLDLLAEHQLRNGDAFGVATDGNPASVQERTAALQQLRQTNEAELQTMLGSKYVQWEDYTQTRPVWQQRRDLRAVLEAEGAPMTEAQDKTLVAALVVEQRNMNQERSDPASRGRSFAEALALHTPERRQRLLNVAAPHLSPQQLEAYRAMLERTATQVQSTLAPKRSN